MYMIGIVEEERIQIRTMCWKFHLIESESLLNWDGSMDMYAVIARKGIIGVREGCVI